MWVKFEFLTPGVQHAEEANFCAKMCGGLSEVTPGLDGLQASSRPYRAPFSIIFQLQGILFWFSAASSAC
jgi:hypothetical protein